MKVRGLVLALWLCLSVRVIGMGWDLVDGWWILRCLDGVVVGTIVRIAVVGRGGLPKGGTDMFNLVQGQGPYVKL